MLKKNEILALPVLPPAGMWEIDHFKFFLRKSLIESKTSSKYHKFVVMFVCIGGRGTLISMIHVGFRCQDHVLWTISTQIANIYLHVIRNNNNYRQIFDVLCSARCNPRDLYTLCVKHKLKNSFDMKSNTRVFLVQITSFLGAYTSDYLQICSFDVDCLQAALFWYGTS